MVEVFEQVTNFFTQQIEFLAFLSPIVAGESGVIFVAFLASANFLTLSSIFIFAFMGMLTIDSFWFFITKTQLYNNFVHGKRISNSYNKIEERLEKLSHSNDVLILMLSKILIGTRILVIIFIGARKLSYSKFLAVIFIPNLIWTGLLVFVGYMARGGYESTVKIFNNTQIGILFVVIFLVLFHYLIKRLNVWILKK